jgi:ABC-type phosphate transport system permease subunit
MTPNMPAALYNTLITAFFVVIVIAAALGAYAAVSLKKFEKRNDQQQQ